MTESSSSSTHLRTANNARASMTRDETLRIARSSRDCGSM